MNISSSHTEEGVQQVSTPLNEGEHNKFYSLKGGCRNLAHCFLFSVRRCVGKAGVFLGQVLLSQGGMQKPSPLFLIFSKKVCGEGRDIPRPGRCGISPRTFEMAR